MNYEKLVVEFECELRRQRSLVTCDAKLCNLLSDTLKNLQRIADHVERVENAEIERYNQGGR